MEPSTKRRKLSDGGVEIVSTARSAGDESDNRNSLFVRSLPASVTSEKLAEHFSQSYPLKHATVVLDPTTKISRGFGFVTFTDVEDAKTALTEFNNSVLDGRKIKVEAAEARHRDSAEKIDGKKFSKNTTGEELRAKLKKEREDNQPPKLIVRNLPWSIKTAEDLTKLFLSYGKVKHAVVPTLPVNKETQAGFGIVIIRGKKNAERALEGVNGRIVDGRTLAVDWAVDKDTWQKMQKEEASQRVEGGTDKAGAQAVDETVTADADKLKIDDDAEDIDSDHEAGDGVDIDEHDVPKVLDADDLPSDEGDIDELDSDSETDADAADTPKFDTQNTTVFIRNLPYDADDDSLAEHFRTNFGPVRYARVVYDHDTERSRGTAFVCFRHEADAKSCVKNCPKNDISDANSTKPKSTYTPNSVLQNTNLDPTGGKYTLSARLLHVTRALPKPEADRRATESQEKRHEKQQSDKRRLYLLSEGSITPGSSLHSILSKTELDIRSSSAKQRQKLVKSNPNLGLSLTRLSVRNMPRWIDAKYLKSLAREAIVGFASDVKGGLRQPISKEELARDGELGRLAEKQRKEQGKGVVKQAKIVYESENTGSKVGEGKGGRSRGYGFIEYWGHRSALMGLRWLNGHLVKKPEDAKSSGEVEERNKRLIVEFAIENAQVVQRRTDRERRTKEKSKQADAESQEPKGGTLREKKRKRDSTDIGRQTGDRQGPNEKGKTVKKKDTKTDVKMDAQQQEERNKIAARNRIISQKREKRKTRK